MYTVEEDFLLRLLIVIDIKSRYGAPREIRTPDQLVRSQLLYPAELWAQGEEYSQVIITGHRSIRLFSLIVYSRQISLSTTRVYVIYSGSNSDKTKVRN